MLKWEKLIEYLRGVERGADITVKDFYTALLFS
jgi:hypothetical protein